ncbi:hypothetical protein [Qaidamihabitans albus]|uniref:hypothetical protein n=1 Tax=Qaidamihabitans albus TaxID=2795733 RepID=UPI0018F186BF|nr:hypothetical protein [Qaidamihabitans albus]
MTSANPFRLLREGAAARLARLVDFRIDDRVAGHVRRIDEQGERLAEQQRCTAEHRRRLDELQKRLDKLNQDLHWTAGEVKRLIPAVAAQEGELETLREKIALTPPADKPELAEARSLIEEVQRQHARIRVRLTGIARYEDRLRKLEERAGATAGD